jgi:hypothetical protein
MPDVNDQVDIGFLRPANGEFIFPEPDTLHARSRTVSFMQRERPTACSQTRRIYTDPFYTASQFSLQFEFASKSSTYDLGFNVIEGSEVVRSGATTLRKDVDYIINYTVRDSFQ